MNHAVPLLFSFTKRITFIRLLFIVTGFIPVSCIALHVMEIVSLHQTAVFVTVPAFLLLVFVGLKHNRIGKLALKGWLAGIIAVALYDIARVPFILAGWDDFVPHLGNWILNEEGNHGLLAYTWRYMGNGGGMGIAFMLLMKKGLSKKEYLYKGLWYGLFIFSNLIFTLIVSPNGQKMMFKITALNFTGSLFGHIIYGLIVGWFANYYFQHKKNT